jgi:hypothetical protein
LTKRRGEIKRVDESAARLVADRGRAFCTRSLVVDLNAAAVEAFSLLAPEQIQIRISHVSQLFRGTWRV